MRREIVQEIILIQERDRAMLAERGLVDEDARLIMRDEIPEQLQLPTLDNLRSATQSDGGNSEASPTSGGDLRGRLHSDIR